jgi:hypothetical protein
MKRILVLAVCAILLVCAFCIPTFATAETDVPAVEETTAVEEPTITESIVDYVKGHIEEISVIITLLLTIFYNVKKHGVLNQSIGTLNNNAITVAQNSNDAIQNALACIAGYGAKIDALLTEFRANAEEKGAQADTLAKVQHFLETAKLANVELADEVAELLVLANIPNSKKDELYARHIAAVNAIADAEKTEVNNHDGEEA